MRTPPGYVDAAPYRELLLVVWRSTELSVDALAEFTGVSKTTIRKVLDGVTPRVLARTADGLNKLYELLPQHLRPGAPA